MYCALFCSSIIFRQNCVDFLCIFSPAVNISITVCPIWLSKMPKEAYRRARFNGAHFSPIRACARVRAVFVRAQPFKLLSSALIKWPRKGKRCRWVLYTFHRKGSTKSEHACVCYSHFCLHYKCMTLVVAEGHHIGGCHRPLLGA